MTEKKIYIYRKTSFLFIRKKKERVSSQLATPSVGGAQGTKITYAPTHYIEM